MKTTNNKPMKKKPKAKKPQPTIATKKTTNTVYEQWKNQNIFYNKKDASTFFKKDLAEKIITTVLTDPTIKVFNEVLRRHNTNPVNLTSLIKTSPELAEAKEYAMFVIGVNRELAALESNPSGNTFTHMQGIYDPEWKAQEEYFNNMKLKVIDKSDSQKEDLINIVKSILRDPNKKNKDE